MKKLQIRIVAIILSLLIATTLLYHPVKVKAAVVAAPTAMQIASFIMGVTGAVDLVTGGGVNAIAGSVRDQLAQTVSGLMGTGIYTDSDGNYVFSQSATQQIYEVLQGSGNSNYRVISSYQGITPMAGLFYYGNPNFNSNVKSKINEKRTLFSSYLCFCSFPKFSNYNPIISNFCIYDLSNVAFIVATNGKLEFYNRSSNLINVNSYRCYYSTSNGFSQETDSQNGILFQTVGQNYYHQFEACNVYGFNLDNDISTSGVGTASNTLSNFPFFGNNGGSLFWANRSILLVNNVNVGYDKYNNPSGVVFANTYDQIPTISPTVITDNNWDSIYNNYVSSVSKNVQYFYDTETNQYNYDEMYKYIKSFNNNITNEVNTGSTDIEQNIEYNNTWLSMIYDTLRSISVKLDDLSSGSGGSSCPWTETDIQNMLSSLSRLENSLSQDITTNQQIFAYLATLNQSILSIVSSNSPQTIYNEYNNYYAALDGLPDADVLDFIGKTDVIKALLPTVAPFGFIALGSAIISGLAAEPVDPVFVMPLQFNHSLVGQTVNIDEEITIDLTPFNSARIVLNAFLVLAFLLSLIFITIELIHRFVDILGG